MKPKVADAEERVEHVDITETLEDEQEYLVRQIEEMDCC